MIVTTKESGITIKFYQAKVQGYAYPAESARFGILQTWFDFSHHA